MATANVKSALEALMSTAKQAARKPTGYMAYLSAMHKQVGGTVPAVSKQAAAGWKGLSPGEKAQYEQRAKGMPVNAPSSAQILKIKSEQKASNVAKALTAASLEGLTSELLASPGSKVNVKGVGSFVVVSPADGKKAKKGVHTIEFRPSAARKK